MNAWRYLKANFNPTLIPKLLGQSTVDHNYQVGGKWVEIYNVAYATVFFICFLVTCHIERIETDGYTFISKLNFYAQFYGMTMYMCFLSLSVTYWKKDIFDCLQDLLRQLNELKSLEAESPVHFPFTRIVTMLAVLIVTQPIFLIMDLINNANQHCFLYWVYLYLPGFTANVYVANATAIMAGCTNRFRAINDFLKSAVDRDLEARQKFAANKMGASPDRLLKKLHSGNVFDRMFELHDETCEIARRMNRASSLEFFVFILISSVAILSFAYNVSMDFVIESRGGVRLIRDIYACDYWAVIYLFAIVSIITESIQLVKNSEDTVVILHDLINIYPQLENGDIYSMQLTHQRLTISAAGLFNIDPTLIYNLLSTWGTFLLILVQFSSTPSN